MIKDKTVAHNNHVAKNRIREKRAYRLRSRGYSNREIADALGMSEVRVKAILI